MNARTVRLLASREIRQRLRSKAYWIVAGLLAVGLIAVGLLARLSSPTTPSYDVVIIDDDGPRSNSGALVVALDIVSDRFELDVESRTTSRPRSDGVRVVDEADAAVDIASAELLFDGSIPDELEAVIDAAWRAVGAATAAEEVGLGPTELTAILEPPELRSVDVGGSNSNRGVGRLVGVLSGVLLFMSLSTFGSLVAQGVVEEKVNAVVEVVLSRVRPTELLAGKVVGVGCAAFIQVLLALVSGGISLAISGASVPSDVWIGLPAMAIWFVFGFAIYASLYALAGSFVSNMEDVQGSSAPVTVALLVAYVTVFVIGPDSGTTLARGASLFPLFSPLLMPVRMAGGTASTVEVLAALALVVIGVLVVVRTAGRIYGTTVLHRGSRITWTSALRAGEKSG